MTGVVINDAVKFEVGSKHEVTDQTVDLTDILRPKNFSGITRRIGSGTYPTCVIVSSDKGIGKSRLQKMLLWMCGQKVAHSERCSDTWLTDVKAVTSTYPFGVDDSSSMPIEMKMVVQLYGRTSKATMGSMTEVTPRAEACVTSNCEVREERHHQRVIFIPMTNWKKKVPASQ